MHTIGTRLSTAKPISFSRTSKFNIPTLLQQPLPKQSIIINLLNETNTLLKLKVGTDTSGSVKNITDPIPGRPKSYRIEIRIRNTVNNSRTS